MDSGFNVMENGASGVDSQHGIRLAQKVEVGMSNTRAVPDGIQSVEDGSDAAHYAANVLTVGGRHY